MGLRGREVKIDEIQETNSHVFNGWKWNMQKQKQVGKIECRSRFGSYSVRPYEVPMLT